MTPTLIFSTYALYIQKTLSPQLDHFVIFHLIAFDSSSGLPLYTFSVPFTAGHEFLPQMINVEPETRDKTQYYFVSYLPEMYLAF